MLRNSSCTILHAIVLALSTKASLQACRKMEGSESVGTRADEHAHALAHN